MNYCPQCGQHYYTHNSWECDFRPTNDENGKVSWAPNNNELYDDVVRLANHFMEVY